MGLFATRQNIVFGREPPIEIN